jgi:hypothetical protein
MQPFPAQCGEHIARFAAGMTVHDQPAVAVTQRQRWAAIVMRQTPTSPPLPTTAGATKCAGDSLGDHDAALC